ncbi:hypothetical protein [Pseudomonas sp. NPDC089547]|uniref:hypothetical protein n=1 Tax=Pseudomonas sp. NPDC089547 TaxID=3390652 RepID=UPI003D034BB9
MKSSKIKTFHLDIETLRRIIGHHPIPPIYLEQYLKPATLNSAEKLNSKGENSNERE